MTDRVVVPPGRLRAFAAATRAMADDLRPRAGAVDAALDRVRATTEPGFRPPVFGDGADVARWCAAVEELDGWAARVADVFEAVDDPTALQELLLLGLAGSPDLPAVDGGLRGLFGLPAPAPDQTVEEFDQIREALDGPSGPARPVARRARARAACRPAASAVGRAARHGRPVE